MTERVELDGGNVVLYRGDTMDVLPTLPEKSVQACVTSPPYFQLRQYATGRWVGGNPDCDHAYNHGTQGDTGQRADRGSAKAQQSSYLNVCGKCGAVREDKQIGNEPTPEAFIASLVAVFRSVKRVLRDDGVVFVVLADSYGRGNRPKWTGDARRDQGGLQSEICYGEAYGGGVATEEDGSLLNVPHLFAEAMKSDGWLLRQTIVWSKKSPVPQSMTGWRWTRCRVKLRKQGRSDSAGQQYPHDTGHQERDRNPDSSRDPNLRAQWADCPGCEKCKANGGYVLRKGSGRPTTSHEYVFMFSKQMNYFWDGEASKEESAQPCRARKDNVGGASHVQRGQHSVGGVFVGSEKRNPRSVWTFSTEPCREAHYATYPSALVHKLLQGAISAGGCCPHCGSPWAPVVEKQTIATRPGTNHKARFAEGSENLDPGRHISITEVSEYRPTCGCHLGIAVDDLEIIASPCGTRVGEDPSLATGRAGMNRPRGDGEGVNGMTRYEQRRYAAQLKESNHKTEMAIEAGPRFAHYTRTDRNGARAIPSELLEQWISRGWILRETVPSGHASSPVGCVVLDPFGGLATTAQTARQMGARAISIELSEEYHEIACKRVLEPPRWFLREKAGKCATAKVKKKSKVEQATFMLFEQGNMTRG